MPKGRSGQGRGRLEKPSRRKYAADFAVADRSPGQADFAGVGFIRWSVPVVAGRPSEHDGGDRWYRCSSTATSSGSNDEPGSTSRTGDDNNARQ